MTRRVLLSCLSAAAGGAWVRFVEPNWFEVTHTDIRIPNAKPTTLLHISDLHISDGLDARDLRRGVRAGLAQKPDLICFTGDYASHSYAFDAIGLYEILREAAESAPTYGVLGNHDGGAWLRGSGGNSSTTRMKDLLDAAGVRLLHNASAQAHGLNVVGIADIWSGEARVKPAFENVDPTRPTIALCHNPDGKALMKPHAWNLMLSGHTHGGQARIPGIAPTWLPVADKRFIAGLYEWEDRNLFITRGLGSPKHVRAFCRPEVSILHLG